MLSALYSDGILILFFTNPHPYILREQTPKCRRPEVRVAQMEAVFRLVCRRSSTVVHVLVHCPMQQRKRLCEIDSLEVPNAAWVGLWSNHTFSGFVPSLLSSANHAHKRLSRKSMGRRFSYCHYLRSASTRSYVWSYCHLKRVGIAF